MINRTNFRDLVSGRRPGPTAALIRAGLRVASIPYGWAVARRNRQFDQATREIVRPPVPVVSVGNLTVGGTGKTPMVEWMSRYLREHHVRVAILSRGYRAAADGRNDEALELELALPDVPHLQNADRAASAAVAVEELATQLLLLDDGFQHRRLARDLDIVLLDASEPFGFDHVLPRGTLREPATGLRRAGVVVLSRADMLDPAGRAAVRARVATLSPDAAWCEVEHRPAALLASDGTRDGISMLTGQTVAAFCGIGNPAGFRHTLQQLGCSVAVWREFPDHHAYTREDVTAIAELARGARASLIVCTRKDLVKLRVPVIGNAPLRAVAVELNFLAGEEALKQTLQPLFDRALRVDELLDEAGERGREPPASTQ